MVATLDELSMNAVLEDVAFYFNKTRDVLAIVGALYATKICLNAAYSLISCLKTYLLPRFWVYKDFTSRYGKWAVVTGASEGIGRSYSIELAKRGMNVVLISRTYSKLEKVAIEIENEYRVKTKIITADFNEKECYDRIRKEIQDLEVGVLVNNVGIMYDRLQYFLTVDSELLEKIVNLNIMSTLLMTREVLSGMVKRKRGAIINLSSGSCVQPVPCMTAYSAAKKFVDFFSSALQYEYGSQGITVQNVMPFYVSTQMTNFMKPNILVPSANDYVDHALRTLQFTNRTYGFWSHGIFGLVGELMPRRLFQWSCIYINIPLWNYMAGVPNQSSKID